MLLRAAVICLAGLILIRAAVFLVYAYYTVLSPLQAYHLEGANVHFAWRFQHGLRLYPEASDGGLVDANLVGPCYFVVIGTIGNLFGADLPDLYTIGRCITVACSLASALLIGVYLRTQHGRLAVLVGAAAALGSGPMVGFGVMVRPDMMAHLLGLLGFLLCRRKSGSCAVASGMALSLSILTKQTTGLYLIAAALALWSEGRRRESAALAGSVCGAVFLVLILLRAAWEPKIVECFFGQTKISFSYDQYLLILGRLLRESPELIYFAMLGAWIPLGNGPVDDRRMRVLLAVVLGGSIGASAKFGSDLNYFLEGRLLAAVAVGSLCHVALAAPRAEWLASLAAGIVLFIPSVGVLASETVEASKYCETPLAFSDGAPSSRFKAYAPQYIALASHPGVRLLTDFDQIAAYQDRRAVLLDPYLLRLRAENGDVNLDGLISRVESRWYDYVVLTGDVNAPTYTRYFWRLPSALADAIRVNYRLHDRRNGFFIYHPAEFVEPRLQYRGRAGTETLRPDG